MQDISVGRSVIVARRVPEENRDALLLLLPVFFWISDPLRWVKVPQYSLNQRSSKQPPLRLALIFSRDIEGIQQEASHILEGTLTRRVSTPAAATQQRYSPLLLGHLSRWSRSPPPSNGTASRHLSLSSLSREKDTRRVRGLSCRSKVVSLYGDQSLERDHDQKRT